VQSVFTRFSANVYITRNDVLYPFPKNLLEQKLRNFGSNMKVIDPIFYVVHEHVKELGKKYVV